MGTSHRKLESRIPITWYDSPLTSIFLPTMPGSLPYRLCHNPLLITAKWGPWGISSSGVKVRPRSYARTKQRKITGGDTHASK